MQDRVLVSADDAANSKARHARHAAHAAPAGAAAAARPAHARPLQEIPLPSQRVASASGPHDLSGELMSAGGSLVSSSTGRLRKALCALGIVAVLVAGAFLVQGRLSSQVADPSLQQADDLAQAAEAGDGDGAVATLPASDAATAEAAELPSEVGPGRSPDDEQGFASHRRRALGSMEQGRMPGSASVEGVESFASFGLVGASANVPELFQYPDMPAGCEVYSLAAVLDGMGIDANPDDIVADQLPFDAVDDDFATAFWGDPYSSGEGMPPAIMIAGNAVLEQAGASERFSNFTGTGFDELAAKATSGSPVLVWTTLGFEDPQFDEPLEANSFYYLEHCVVLLGISNGRACVMDPTQGYVTVDYSWFKHLYEQCGSMALAVG